MPKVELGDNRPLSPHLSIYKPIPTMVMSILHRLSGAALYFGTLLFVWWLFAAATGPAYFEWVNGLFGSWFGRLVLFGYTWALIHHMAGGIKHLIWDTGRGLEKAAANRVAWLTLICSVTLTLAIWIASGTLLPGAF